MKKIKRKTLKEIFFYVRVVLLVVILLFPFLIMLSVSIKSTAETIAYPPTVIPKTWTFQHFIDIFDPGIFPYLKYFGNSLYIALTVSVLAVFLGRVCAFKAEIQRKKGNQRNVFPGLYVFRDSAYRSLVPYALCHRVKEQQRGCNCVYDHPDTSHSHLYDKKLF